MNALAAAHATIAAARPGLVAELQAMSAADRYERVLLHAEAAEDARIVGNVVRFRMSNERSALIAAVDLVARVEASA